MKCFVILILVVILATGATACQPDSESITSNWLFVAAFLVYVGTVFGPWPFLAQWGRELDAGQFKEAYPHQRWLPLLHEILSWPVFLFWLLGGPLIADVLVDDSAGVGIGAWFFVAGVNLFNGAFELVTGVCPTYGILIKRYSSQGYLRHPTVRK